MTNFEKIKQMSVEELAEFLNGTTGNIALKFNGEYVSNLKGSLCEYLNSEVRE